MARFPAFGAALIHTEVRDNADLCFHTHDFEAFRKASGIDIPPEVVSRSGVDYHADRRLSRPTASFPTTIRSTSSIAGTGRRATAGTA